MVNQVSPDSKELVANQLKKMDANNLVNTATYLKDEFGIIWIPFFPFLGNRFSILFVNAAGLYFLYDQLLNCF